MRTLLLLVFCLLSSLCCGQAFSPVKVSGAGTAAVNGSYAYAGPANGRPLYTKPGYQVRYNSVQACWDISSTGGVTTYYRSGQTGNTPDAPTSWTVLSGAAPAPTVTGEGALTLDGGPIAQTGTHKTWDGGPIAVPGARFTLTVSEPYSVARPTTAATSVTTTEQDRTVVTVTGSSSVSDYIWEWRPADSNSEPGTVSRASTNNAIIIPKDGDPYRWTYVGSGTATLRLTTSSGLVYQRTVTTSVTGAPPPAVSVTSYAAGSLRQNIMSTIDSRLAGKAPVDALRIFSTYNPSSQSYVRNVNCWAYGLDLTAISPGNSQTNNLWAGALVTPRHFIVCAHASMGTGAVMHFVGQDNTLYTRTITSITTAGGYTNYYPDYRVATLDSDVPAEITYAKVLPDNWPNKLPSLNYTYRVPALCLDQEEKALVTDLAQITAGAGMYGSMAYFTVPADTQRQLFYEEKIGGDSGNPAFLIINNQLVLLNVWTFGGAGSGTSLTGHKAAINALIEASTDASFVSMNGTQYAATADNANVSVTGDIDIRLRIAPNDWTPTSAVELVQKLPASTAYRFRLETDGALGFYMATGNAKTTGFPVGAVDGTKRWVRVTRTQSSGIVRFYTSTTTDGSSWTQLGTDYTFNAGMALGDSTENLVVCANFNGKLYHASVWSGATLRARFNPLLLQSLAGYTDTAGAANVGWSMTGTVTKGGYSLHEIDLSGFNTY